MRDDDLATLLAELHDSIHAPAVTADDDVRRGERLVRRRRMTTVAAVATVATAVLAVPLVRAASSDDFDDLQFAPAPSSPASSGEGLPDDEVFEAKLREIVAEVPDWSIANTQAGFHSSPCAGDWLAGVTGGTGGNFDVSTNGEPGQVWHQVTGFRSAAEAADAVDVLADGLSSCASLTWRAEPMGRTGVVMFSSADGLFWVLRNGSSVAVLEAATTDGPPPHDVQVEVADLLSSELG